MDDRTLLELAARAAGSPVEWREVTRSRVGAFKAIEHTKVAGFFHNGLLWNPLVCDGDAFRLAVKLGLQVCGYCGIASAEVWNAGKQLFYISEEGDDKGQEETAKALRRAIVRAAAEVGKGMLTQDEFVRMFPGRFDDEEVTRAAVAIGEGMG